MGDSTKGFSGFNNKYRLSLLLEFLIFIGRDYSMSWINRPEDVRPLQALLSKVFSILWWYIAWGTLIIGINEILQKSQRNFVTNVACLFFVSFATKGYSFFVVYSLSEKNLTCTLGKIANLIAVYSLIIFKLFKYICNEW